MCCGRLLLDLCGRADERQQDSQPHGAESHRNEPKAEARSAGRVSFSVRTMSLPSFLYWIMLLFDYYAAAATYETSCTRHCYNLFQVFEDPYCHVYNNNVEGGAQSQAPSNNFHAILIK